MVDGLGRLAVHQRRGQCQLGGSIVGPQAEGALKLEDRLFWLVILGESAAETPVNVRLAGLQFDGLFKIGYGFRETTGRQERIAEIVMDGALAKGVVRGGLQGLLIGL